MASTSGSDELWPEIVVQAFRDHGEALTWQMAQSLASKVMKTAGIKYGKNTVGWNRHTTTPTVLKSGTLEYNPPLASLQSKPGGHSC